MSVSLGSFTLMGDLLTDCCTTSCVGLTELRNGFKDGLLDNCEDGPRVGLVVGNVLEGRAVGPISKTAVGDIEDDIAVVGPVVRHSDDGCVVGGVDKKEVVGEVLGAKVVLGVLVGD